jgi:hypothetical protein
VICKCTCKVFGSVISCTLVQYKEEEGCLGCQTRCSTTDAMADTGHIITRPFVPMYSDSVCQCSV